MPHSQRKGKTGELELAAVIRGHGFTARRGQQFCGGTASPDVVTDIDGVHFECKRTETVRLYEYLAQAQRDASPDQIPVVAHRQSRKEWVAILPLDDFLKLVKVANGKRHPEEVGIRPGVQAAA